MNTYVKFCPNVYVAKCETQHEKGDVIEVTTKYGKMNECEVHNLVGSKDGFFYYSITRVDGVNGQEIARRKAERYELSANNAEKRASEYYKKSQKDADFLSLAEPIKVGHHSEARHRKCLADAQRNTQKFVDELDKADSLREKAERLRQHAEDVNLSMPESLEYYADKLAKAEEYHEGLKSGKYPKTHSYSVTYAKKAVNEARKNLELAKRLWA
jgi:hypothetical protein